MGIYYKKKVLLPENKGAVAIVIASLLWGFEFVVEKDVLAHIEPNWSNVIRFSISSIIIIIVCFRKFRKATRDEWKKGLFSGLILGCGFAFQTMGLESINAGVNAFLSSAYIVIIPFLVWLIKKIRPEKLVFISAGIAIVGVTLMSLNGLMIGDISIGRGEILTLAGSVFYAGGIVSVEYYANSIDSMLFAGIQCIATFGVSTAFALLFESPPSYFDPLLFWEFVYLTIFATIITQILFTYGMKYVSSHRSSILFLLESISAVVFGWILLGERLKISQIVGAIIIVIAIALTSFTEKEEKL